MLRLLVVALLLGGCGGREAAPTAHTTSETSSSQPDTAGVKAHSSQGVLDGALNPDEPGCSAAVGREGKVVWTGVRGVANVATDTAIVTGTVFDIASVSKQFTATAVLLLADAGPLALDDPLSQYVSGLPPWAATVTVAQLIHHTSGIPDYTELLTAQGYRYSDRTTQAQAVQALAKVSELEFRPGARFEYSNSNYLLLGEIVHRVSGKPLPEYLNTEVFQPLGLAMVMDPLLHDSTTAVSYEREDAKYSVADSAWEQIGDGAILTTPSQLVRWADNYRTGKVGGQKLLDAQLAGAVETEPGGGDRYGAGIYLLADGSLDHNGSWAGSVSAFRVSKDRRTSVAVSCNSGDRDPDAMADALEKFWM